MSSTGVKLLIQDHLVVIENGILQVTISNPEGNITGIRYNGIANLLEDLYEEDSGGYWDIVWNSPDGTTKTRTHELIKATNFKVIVQTDELVEVSFTRPWSSSPQSKTLAPINIDKRYILLRGCSGFYCYGIYEHLDSKEWPGFSLNETRIAFKLRKHKFRYIAVADDGRQRHMPLPEDRVPPRGKPLAYPEAVLLVKPMEPEFEGEMFHSEHYAGDDMVPKFMEGELWRKVYGPIFIYLNAVEDGDNPLSLWDDAKNQMLAEVKSWPYSFPASKDFPQANQRGNVTGRLLVSDRYIDKDDITANGAFIGLAPPGDVKSWETDGKGYQYWTQVDESGNFSIENIRIGEYNLYAWVPGFLGDYRYNITITITPGQVVNAGNLVYEPPRDGPTLWEIGIPDRSASEFYIPDPDAVYKNNFLNNPKCKFRQYGLWERYSELYPHGDLVFKVGESDYKKDWFFAQVTRKIGEKTYEGTMWRIEFKLDNIHQNSTYKLRVSLAAASSAELQVRVNNPKAAHPLFSSGEIGSDSAIARHGIRGLYWLFNIDISGSLLTEGDNSIYLAQPRSNDAFNGIMYDYIRLEGPPT